MPWRLAFQLGCAFLGTLPWLYYYHLDWINFPFLIILSCIGALVGFALASPSISKRNVVEGLAEFTPLFWPVKAMLPPRAESDEIVGLNTNNVHSRTESRTDTIKLEWLTENVVAIARGISMKRSYYDLPVLGDALIEAGCDDEKILEHCQRTSIAESHSWVVEAIILRQAILR